jgi:hypothetical protein
MRRSGWTYRRRFRELEAAHAWGCPSPTSFDDLDRDDRAEIVAWYEAKWRMDAVNIHESRPKPKPQPQRKGRRR